MPDVSIIIVSFNTRDVTCQCLQSIVEQTKEISYEIIVVDNHSADDSVERIRQAFPDVRLFQSPTNGGFAVGQNQGILQAQGECILILNSDIIILDNAIAKLHSALKEGSPELAVVGPRVQQLDGSLAPSARRAQLGWVMLVLGILNRHFHFRRFLPERTMRRFAGGLLGMLHDNYRPHDLRIEAEYVDGMCAMVHRTALEKAGLFDEQFFFDYEIIDLSNRIRAFGYRIEFIPDARVIHIGHVSRKKTSRILIETVRSELTYYAKYSPRHFPLIRRLHQIAVSIKLGYFWFISFLGSRDSERDIYRGIRKVCREFQPSQAVGGARVPRLPTEV